MVSAHHNRKNEVDSNATFARDASRSYSDVSFKVFCQHLQEHAHEGASFASDISTQTPQTIALQQSFSTLAKQAARLQSVEVSPEVESALRLLLIRDLLAATEQEKNIHDNAMPANHADRFKKLALFVGSGLALGAGIGMLGDALIDGVPALNGTFLPGLPQSFGEALYNLKLIDTSVSVDLDQFTANVGISGLNEGTFSALGGAAGAMLGINNAIVGHHQDKNYQHSLDSVGNPSSMDAKLAQAGSKEFQTALALYNNKPLIAEAQAETHTKAATAAL